MQQLQFNEDEWDDLIDETTFENCILKETECLSQNPSLLKKSDYPVGSSRHKGPGNWVVNNFNNTFSSGKNYDNSTKKIHSNDSINACGSGLQSRKKEVPAFNAENFNLPSSSTNQVIKKQSHYKPLSVGASSLAKSSVLRASKLRHGSEDSSDYENKKFIELEELNSIKIQLEQVLKDKAKLEEENLVKQGEVINLRRELKRKEVNQESERIDQCMAVEAAEKRGKDKALKNITDIEVKVKSLEKEVDRLQGDLIFKDREVEELVAKCKHLEKQNLTSRDLCNDSLNFPSPKKRKIDKISPSKTAHSFIERFDFGNHKKNVKNTQTQTECKTKNLKRTVIKVSSKEGKTMGSRKTYYMLSQFLRSGNNSPSSKDTSERTEMDLLGELVFSDNAFGSEELENRLVTQASTNLEKTLEKFHSRSPDSVRNIGLQKSKEVIMSQMLTSVKVLGLARARKEEVSQNAVASLSHVIEFLKDVPNNSEGLAKSFHALCNQIKQCSLMPKDLCKMMSDMFRGLTRFSTLDVCDEFIRALNSLVIFDNFKKLMCMDTTEGKCLLSSICTLLKPARKKPFSQETCNNLIFFVTELLRSPSYISKTSSCKCLPLLFSLLIGHLYNVSMSNEDKDWHCVITGIKALHLWKSSDKVWWNQNHNINTYTSLLSTIVRKADYLKEKGIVDQHAWNIIYEIYDVDSTS